MGMVNEYLAAARTMDAEQFLAKYGNPVLVQQGKADLGDPRNEYRSTLKMRIDHERGEVQVETPAPGPEDLVLEVKKSGRNSVQGKILIGRTETNDIPIPDITVSKHHAFM
ncbi:MAG: FHA domain-containing protein, partial [Deltaproteobacteria bacterium]